jgi:hypothetical protein
VSPLFRKVPLVRAEVALHGPRRAAVLLHPADGRWPESERADRLAVGLGAAALASRAAPPPRWEAYRAALVTLAARVARSPAGPLRGDLVDLTALGQSGLLQVVPWEGEGRLGVETEIVTSSSGLVPRIVDRPDEAGPALEIASLALLIALAADADEDRLALALGVEGLMAWHRESDRQAPPRAALTFALAHAEDRLREAGRTLPPGL